MAAQKGRAMLLKTGPVATAVTVGCQNTTSLTVNNEQVDITNKDSAGVRALLENAGVQSFAFSAAGIYDDDVAIGTLQTNALANTIDTYTIVFGNTDTWQFEAAITSFEYSGAHDGAQQYTVSFEADGAPTVAT